MKSSPAMSLNSQGRMNTMFVLETGQITQGPKLFIKFRERVIDDLEKIC